MSKKMMDLTSAIIAFENGELEMEEIIELFQTLVDTGLEAQLQGSYGRAARDLYEQGLIKRNGKFKNETDK
jgi:hypothetical protein